MQHADDRDARPEETSDLVLNLDTGMVEVHPARILVVEDDLEMRRYIAAVLKKDGHDVIELADGEQFLEFVESRALEGHGDSAPADLVVTDLRMPGLGGLDILRTAWAARWEPKMPVILITAFGDRKTHNAARLLGAWAILDKPFDADELRKSVRYALRSAW